MPVTENHTALDNKTALEDKTKFFRRNHKANILADFYKQRPLQINGIVIEGLVDMGRCNNNCIKFLASKLAFQQVKCSAFRD